MTTNARRTASRLILGSAALLAGTLSAAAQAAGASDKVEEIIVTGSRIKRANMETPTPLTAISPQTLQDYGYVQIGQALNLDTSVNPFSPVTPFNGSRVGTSQQYPALFGLGPGRTLTLVNSRRYVSSASLSSGAPSFGTGSSTGGDNLVDTNMIPTGLLQRVDIVPAGGAAVYGTDAIAGVVNYVLKDHFEGLELDAQAGASTYSDYPAASARVTYGTDFADHRGNVAVDLEWSRTDSLLADSRPESARARLTGANPTYPGPGHGVAPTVQFFNGRFWEFNTNGIIFTTPAPVPVFLLKTNGTPTQFTPSGGLAPYSPGTTYGVPFASGGDGFPYENLSALYGGVERRNANLIGHYDLTDHVKVSTELTYGWTDGHDPVSIYSSNTVLNSASTGSGVIPFTSANPFLSAATIAALSASSATFAHGGPLFLSKLWPDLPNTNQADAITESYRGLIALDGDVTALARKFDWSVSYARGETNGSNISPSLDAARMSRALSAVKNSAGQIVCAVNASAVNDPACVPINPFGAGNVASAAAAYVSSLSGQTYIDTQDDFLANFSGPIFKLPGGDLKFSLGYEYRAQRESFKPTDEDSRGLSINTLGVPVVPQSGSFSTNELSAELLAPLIGESMKLPLVQRFEVDLAGRTVNNSLAGSETVYDVGGRWQVVTDLAMRGSISRNFRAPTLAQLDAPSRTSLGSILGSTPDGAADPCDLRYIAGGLVPATRRANCAKLFAANPQWGSLGSFQDPAVNFSQATITSGGNPNLRNEISYTHSWGFVIQPRWIEGLTASVDRVMITLKNGLSPFGPGDFLGACFDALQPPANICNLVKRDPATGYVVSGPSTTFNAGRIRFRGWLYDLEYAFPVGRFFGDRDLGRLSLALNATRTTLADLSVTGFDLTRNDGTPSQPEWVGNFAANYSFDDWRISYQAHYLSQVRSAYGASVETSPTPIIHSNITQDISGQYDFGRVTLRAGVTNFLNERPSYPTLNYGNDIIGRQFFVGARADLW